MEFFISVEISLFYAITLGIVTVSFQQFFELQTAFLGTYRGVFFQKKSISIQFMEFNIFVYLHYMYVHIFAS